MGYSVTDTALCVVIYSVIELTPDHHCGGEILKSITSEIGWNNSEKSLLHSDEQQGFTRR